MKVVFFLLMFLIANSSLFSQTTFGIKTAYNLSKAVYLDQSDEELVKPFRKLKPGISAGFFVNHELNEVLSLQVDLLYSQKGLRFEQLSHNKTVNTMNYLELPLSGQYKLFQGVMARYSASLGGYVAFWTDGFYKYTDLTTGETDIVKVEFNNPDYSYNRLDIGIFGGIEMKFKRLNIFFRYSHSMSSSSQENADALTNRVLSVGLELTIL